MPLNVFRSEVYDEFATEHGIDRQFLEEIENVLAAYPDYGAEASSHAVVTSTGSAINVRMRTFEWMTNVGVVEVLQCEVSGEKPSLMAMRLENDPPFRQEECQLAAITLAIAMISVL